MARIVSTYVETAEGRDKGKKFVITEMSAYAGFDWATRLMIAMATSGANIPPETMRSGMAGLVSMIFAKDDVSSGSMAGGLSMIMNLIGRMPHHMAKPLMDELLACVQVLPENGQPRTFFDGDVEEILTLFSLQRAAFDLHASPFLKGVKSISELMRTSTPAQPAV